jgi:ubiquinone/menaquinone biosynthesis C-methylase UbiE
MTKGYNRIAGIYDSLAQLVFGKAMIQSQTVFLDRMQDTKSLLVLGGGTGWWLNDLMEMNPHLKITFVDSSSEMIRIAKTKLNLKHQVDFVCGTIDSVEVNDKFDGVILYYFADLFSEEGLSVIIQRLIQRMNDASIWLVTDFANKKGWHSGMLKIMYAFFGFTTGQKSNRLPDWQNQLEKAGLIKMEQRTFYGKFMESVLYRLTKA